MYLSRIIFALFILSAFAGCNSSKEVPYSNHSVLINTEKWLDEIDEAEPFVYVDLRPESAYKEGHLPGAINLRRDEIQDGDFEYTGMALDRDSVALLLGKKGISADKWMVLYDDKGGVEAARLWWLMKLYGHEKVKILNGDLHLFESELESGTAEIEKTEFRFQNEGRKDWVVDYTAFEKMRANPSVVVLDCRSAAEYNGEYIKPGAFLAGHVEGAINICYSNTVENLEKENMRLKRPEDLAEVYKNIAQTNDTILVYCQSGVRSALTLMVLREILDYEHVYNYDGSWVEWSYMNKDKDV
jgi:thiosulfate/3-mercaptopyruvate sulfurtransferase